MAFNRFKPRQPKEKDWDAVCLVVDVGLTCKSSGFLKSIIQCCSEQIQRKVYAESTDRFGIVLCGTRNSSNKMDYEHVTVPDLNDGCFSLASFELLEFVEKGMKGYASNSEGDWLDAVVVALDQIKENTENSAAVKSKRIILFSDVGCPAKEDQLQTILKAMQKEQVEFTFIGPKWKPESDEMDLDEDNHDAANGNDHSDERKPMTVNQCNSDAMITYLVENTGGFKVDIDTALATFLNKERRKKKPFPWKVDLEIGTSIKIPMVGFVHIRRESPKTWKKCLARPDGRDDGETWELKPATTFVKNDEDMTVVQPDELIESYKYGSELIAVSDVDKDGLFDAGPKSMILIGFIKSEEVPVHLLLGDGSMVFQPIEDNQSSIAALSALVNGMHTEETVALVRRVYRAKTTPKLGILVPSVKRDPETLEESMVLAYIEMPYMEDIRYFQFAPLFNDKIKPSDDQLAAIDDLITALKVEDSTVLQTESILNPYYQHLYQCLTHRALNPGRVLAGTSEHTKKIMEQPDELKNKSEKPLEKIKELFKLEEVIFKTNKTTGDKFFASGAKRLGESAEDNLDVKRVRIDDLNLSTNDQVLEVGTTNPVEDFLSLLKQGFDLSTVSLQIEKVILNLLQTTFGGDFSEKILESLAAYRTACLERRRPTSYNDFVKELKPEILGSTRYGLKFWKEFCEQGLYLIHKDIEGNSDITREESDAFQKVDIDVVNETTVDHDVKDDTADEDMLDDL